MPETDRYGNVYIYSVKEGFIVEDEFVEAQPLNYIVSGDGLVLTNTYVSPKIEITGEKIWVDGPEVKPAIELQLFRDGEEYGEPVTLEDGVLTHTWTDLDLTDSRGVEYVYHVDEVEVPENYVKELFLDDYVVQNTYVSPLIDITGTKVWVGGPLVKPDIELQLFRDGIEFGEPVTLVDGELTYTWFDLDKTDALGVDYVYTVDEVSVPENYINSAEGPCRYQYV